MEDFVVELFNIGCVKFGEFLLKSGIKSPVYFDMRILVSYPKLMSFASELFYKKITESEIGYDLICGVPYGAISLATALSLKSDKPMIFKRKDAKSHGTKKMVEGVYNKNQQCLIVDDVITSGLSILETLEGLRDCDIQVNDALVLLDREQGGAENISNSKVKLHSVFKTNEILRILFDKEKISQEMFDKTLSFLNANKKVPVANSAPTSVTVKELSFEERANLTNSKLAKKLFTLMSAKRTNLCLAADFSKFDDLLKAADELGPFICILKTHVDIIDDFSMDKIEQLKSLAAKHNFLIFEDRKFADIGNTVKSQFNNGVYKISDWADIVNSHSIAGPGAIKALKQACDYENKACLLIAQLSSDGNLIDEKYTNETVRLAEENEDFVIGFISQKRLSEHPGLLHITPGIQLSESSDSLGQKYNTPENAIIERLCDIIVVGRGIINSSSPVQTAAKYQQIAYDSYLKRITK